MKHHLHLIDVLAAGQELQNLVGKRVNSVYCINAKTILIKTNDKIKLLMEMGSKVLLTSVEHETSTQPLQTLLRQHLNNRIITQIGQLNNDRILQIHFHPDYVLTMELYGQGNLTLHKGQGTPERLYSFQEATSTYTPKEIRLIEDIKDLKNDRKHLQQFDYGKDLTKELQKVLVDHGESRGMELVNKWNQLILNKDFKGFVYYKQETPLVLDDIITVSPIQLTLEGIELQYDTFLEALDVYFTQVEQCKLYQKQAQHKLQLEKKIKDIQTDQQRRIDELGTEIENVVQFAVKIEEYNAEITEIIGLVNNIMSTGMDWQRVAQILEVDKMRYKELRLIHRLLLDKGSVEVSLDGIVVKVNLAMTSFGNVQHFYSKRKALQDKLQRTEEAFGKSLKMVQKSVTVEQTKIDAFYDTQLIKKRNIYWFEKFYWFVSTEGFLVIAGRDMHQNELIVKRYLRKGDLYLHADIHGSPSVIVKGIPGRGIPESTLLQAGTFTVCLSKAWDAKVVTSAYYVYPNQVSTTAPSGEYLSTGSFMIRGKKNYLPPIQLVLGFGFLFKIDEASAQNHAKAEREQVQSVDSWQMPSDVHAEPSTPNIFAQSKVNQLATRPDNPLVQQLLESSGSKQKQQQKGSRQKGSQQSQKQGKQSPPPSEDPKQKASMRSKKKKLKKSSKYQDQDDEEREIARALLEGTKMTSKEPQPAPVVEDTLPQSLSPTNRQPPKSQEAYNEQKQNDAEQEMSEISMLHLLVGDPNPDDVLEGAIPFCGPYDALKQFKFKVKLTPGTEKKGKSAKTALQVFLANKELNSTEKSMLRGIVMDQVIRVLPSKCKVSAPNLLAVKKKRK